MLGIYGGVISDRVDRRRLLILTQSLQAMATGTLAIATLNGSATVGLVYAIVLIQGLVGSVEIGVVRPGEIGVVRPGVTSMPGSDGGCAVGDENGVADPVRIIL